MPFFRSALLIILTVSLVQGADEKPEPKKNTVDIDTLAGRRLKGELVSVDSKTLTVKLSDKDTTFPLDQILAATKDTPPAVIPKGYTLVELNDGTQFRCQEFSLKKQQIKMKLINSEASVTASLTDLKFLLKQADDPKILEKWKPILAEKNRTRDVFVRNLDGQLNALEGTILEADDEGKTVKFTYGDNKQVDAVLANAQALLFTRGPLKDAKPQVCRYSDANGNIIVAADVAIKGNNFALSTLGDIKVELPFEEMTKMDFSKGKLVYLSDLDYNFTFRYDLADNQEYAKQIYGPVKDKNMARSGPIRIGSTEFRKGMSLHAHTDIIFKLDGDYEWFNAVVGFDDEYAGVAQPVVITIYGDGKELKTLTLNRLTDKAPVPLKIQIRDANSLRIVVRSGGRHDGGVYIELGDAQVTK